MVAEEGCSGNCYEGEAVGRGRVPGATAWRACWPEPEKQLQESAPLQGQESEGELGTEASTESLAGEGGGWGDLVGCWVIWIGRTV